MTLIRRCIEGSLSVKLVHTMQCRMMEIHGCQAGVPTYVGSVGHLLLSQLLSLAKLHYLLCIGHRHAAFPCKMASGVVVSTELLMLEC